MTWSFYREDGMINDRRVHINQQINANRLDYALKRFSDWVIYRTNWFMARQNQREGPELSLIGNNKILWSTLESSDQRMAQQRSQMIGISQWVNRFKMEKPANNGVFIAGTLNGKISITNCKSVQECKNKFLTYQNNRVTNVPYIMIHGQRNVWARYARSIESWNGIHGKYD